MKIRQYENTLNNTKIENDSLIKDDQILISVGDEFKERNNPFRAYRCTSIDLHNLHFEKTAVGDFEPHELGKVQVFLTAHFINKELGLTGPFKPTAH